MTVTVTSARRSRNAATKPEYVLNHHVSSARVFEIMKQTLVWRVPLWIRVNVLGQYVVFEWLLKYGFWIARTG